MFCDLTRDDVFRLETRRLWLRWPTLADAEALQAIAAHREVAWMTATWPHPLPEGEAARRIGQMRASNGTGRALCVVLAPKPTPDAIIGCAGVFISCGEADLGYFLATQHWGQGLMTEAIAALVEASFRLSAVKLIGAGCWSHNTASRRVLEKCGFSGAGIRSCKAPARGGEAAADHFELARHDWEARTRRLAA